MCACSTRCIQEWAGGGGTWYNNIIVDRIKITECRSPVDSAEGAWRTRRQIYTTGCAAPRRRVRPRRRGARESRPGRRKILATLPLPFAPRQTVNSPSEWSSSSSYAILPDSWGPPTHTYKYTVARRRAVLYFLACGPVTVVPVCRIFILPRVQHGSLPDVRNYAVSRLCRRRRPSSFLVIHGRHAIVIVVVVVRPLVDGPRNLKRGVAAVVDIV